MNKWRYLVSFCVAVFLWEIPLISHAADEVKDIASEKSEVYSDNGRADDWFTKPKEVGRITNQSSTETKEQEKKEKERYVFLLEDNGFAYYLDSQNARWRDIPYSESEKILDVWIRLVKVEPDEEYSYPQKYFLEHYYLRPKTQQIQFLSELEVAGRPDNAIKERPYSVHNWENIVSGSLEDEIYHSVMKVMKKKNQFWPAHTSVRDVLEDVFRISL